MIQTDWFPEAEHGALYELIGDDYDVDTGTKVVAGRWSPAARTPASTSRSAPAVRRSATSRCRPACTPTTSIHLGYGNTDGQILRYDETPVLSVIAPLEINPQIIYWDPETYPDVETLADLGEEDMTINVFAGGTFADVFVAEGIWNEGQIDPSYDGSPARFVAEDGAIAQQGFASAEPYTYENVFEEWGKPVAFQLLHDAGFQVYSQTLAIVPTSSRRCGRASRSSSRSSSRPRSTTSPTRTATNALIVDAVEQYDDFWVYDAELADFSVQTQHELGLVGNGPDDTLGNMDEARVQGVIDQIRDAGHGGAGRPDGGRPRDRTSSSIPTSGYDMRVDTRLRLTMTAAIHARFAHRVDGLVHSHPWSVEATVEGRPTPTR